MHEYDFYFRLRAVSAESDWFAYRRYQFLASAFQLGDGHYMAPDLPRRGRGDAPGGGCTRLCTSCATPITSRQKRLSIKPYKPLGKADMTTA